MTRPSRLLAPRPFRAALVFAACALAAALTGCSGPSAEEKAAYCAKLSDNSDVMEQLGEDPDAQDAGTIAKLREIQNVAPKDVRGEWKTLVDYLQAIADRDEKTINDDVNKAASAATKVQQSIQEYCPASASPSATP